MRPEAGVDDARDGASPTEEVPRPGPGRRRAARWVAGGASAVAAGALLTAWILYSQARSTVCETRRHEPLSMAELIDVRKRFERYRQAPEIGLTLSGPELSMLLEDRADPPIWVDFAGDRVTVEVALPSTESRCFPVRFEGAFVAADGVATVVPDTLSVGALDLTLLTRGSSFELHPDEMPSARSATFLRQTRAAAPREGRLAVELKDPATFSWRSQPTASAAP